MLWTGLAALGAVGVYFATRGKKGADIVEQGTEAGQNIANQAADTVREQTAKILEKLPSRKKVLESLGVKFNDARLLAVVKKDLNGKDVEQLYTGTHSYTARKGVNIEEYVENGIVKSRKMFTQKMIDHPVIKEYDYYFAANLRGISTFKDGWPRSVFTSKNQTALRNLRDSLNFTPKTEAEIKELSDHGIKYEVVEEVADFGQHGHRKNFKEIYTYPESYPVKTKEVYYGDRNSTSNIGKEITLTFREPQQTVSPYYKADGFKLNIRDVGFTSELLGGRNLDRFEYLYDIKVIPFNDRTKAYKEIKSLLEEEYSAEALRQLRYGF